ncbi:hypothetical protein BDR22DRAFT_400907 [Usnea florida]
MESKAASALYVGIAYWIGYGVIQNMEESRSWISTSAIQGSPAASLILKILENPHSRYDMILGGFKNSFEGEEDFSRQANCRFGHHSSDVSELSSFSSVDGCNPLHYLSLFEGLVEHQSYRRKDELDLLKRKDLKAIPIGPQTPRVKDEERIPGGMHDKTQSLDQIVNHLGLNFICQSTNKVHYLDTHFPMILDGTPLSFAITLNCREAIVALVNQLGDSSVLRGSKIEPSNLETAVSCHQSEVFSLLWSSLLSTVHGKELLNTFVDGPNGPVLIEALAKRSTLERTILHGPFRAEAQTKTIRVVVLSLSALITQEEYDDNKLGSASDISFMAFIGLMSDGCERVLELGDLEIAIEVRQTIRFQGFEPSLDKACRHRICKAALKVACSGYVDLQRSKQFLDFARDCIKDEDPDFQILVTVMEHKSESLFRLCVGEGFDVTGRAEDGQGLLHYMISTGFHSLVPISLLIDRGADPFHASSHGQTPLYLAVKKGLLMIVDEILSKGAKSLAADKHGSSTLLNGSGPPNYPTVAETSKMCKANIGRLEAIDSDNIREISMALRTAAKNQDIEMIKLLLRNGARADLEDLDGDVALHYAIQGPTSAEISAVSCCRVLCNAAKDYLPQNKEGNTPLHYAAERYKGEGLRHVLTLFMKQLRADISVQNKRGETILHQAAQQDSIELVTIMCEFGAAPNLKTYQGLTAMHLWVQTKCRSAIIPFTRSQKWDTMLMTLFDAGANPLVLDGSETGRGFTAMDHAAINGNDALLCAVFDISHRFLCRTIDAQSSRHWKAQKQWFESAWSLSVVNEQWRVVRELLLNRPHFNPDMSLLVWPKSARLLKYALAVRDSQLLRKFSQTAQLGPELPSIPESDDIYKYSSVYGKAWELSIRYEDVHVGRNQLIDTFRYLAIQEWLTLRQYFGKATHERHLPSEYAFRWEDTLDYRTPYYAGFFLHSKDYYPGPWHSIPRIKHA